jgi:hypothetical protein
MIDEFLYKERIDACRKAKKEGMWVREAAMNQKESQ